MFMSMEKRDEYYKSKAYIHTKRVSAKTLGITCETYLQGIFIDECLAKETRVLFKQCREKLECLGYKCYTEHQQIYVKKPQLARRKIFPCNGGVKLNSISILLDKRGRQR